MLSVSQSPEGHKFHSVRNSIAKTRGFQPLRLAFASQLRPLL